jgi:uncharacterized Tic20 family protein
MPTGELLGWILLVLVLSWGAADLVVWLTGRQTFSQWVIKESKKRLSFALTALCIVVFFGWWLIDHWELFDIIWEHVE